MNPPLSFAYDTFAPVPAGVMKMYPSASGALLLVMVMFGGVAVELLKTRHGQVSLLGSVWTCLYASLGITVDEEWEVARAEELCAKHSKYVNSAIVQPVAMKDKTHLDGTIVRKASYSPIAAVHLVHSCLRQRRSRHITLRAVASRIHRHEVRRGSIIVLQLPENGTSFCLAMA